MSIRHKILIACGLTLTVVGLLSFGYYARALDEAAEQEVLATARAFFRQIVITRRWIARHGGVYVAKEPGVETNPYLLEIPDLAVDVTDTQGRIYTLRNPALVTRELSALAEQEGVFQFHITSLKLRNPDNAPDDFEIKALQAFERGEAEARRYEEEGDQRRLRYMAPLFVEEACLRCHGDQGYSVGDVLGGISVTIPAATGDGSARVVLALGWTLGIAATLGILYWALNITIIGPIERLRTASDSIAGGNYENAISATTHDEIGDLARAFERMRLKVHEYTHSLEEVVRQRTAELEAYSERLEEMVEERAQELRDAQEQLVRRERLAVLGQLAGGMGHEMRNPLGAIKNAVYFLNMALDEPDPEVQEALAILGKEVETSERIINSLLDFARTKAPVRREVDVNDIVRETLSRTAVPAHIEVEQRLDESLPVVQADPDQLGQVFGNLILNAMQAMPAGGRLAVRTWQEEQKDRGARKRSVVVSISDTGAGIPKEDLGKVFEPLFTTKARGIGLGLALAKTLVEGNGGIITVESEAGEGSTFTVRLPLAGE